MRNHDKEGPKREKDATGKSGARRNRTADLNTASVALYQLSYDPSVETAHYTAISSGV